MADPVKPRSKRSGRSGGAAARRESRLRGPVVYLPNAIRNIPTYEILKQDGLEAIDDHAMGILETIGVEFRDDISAKIWADAGADVDGHRVRIPRELIRKLIATVPSEFDYHAHNPDRSVKVGGRNMIFGPAYGTPNLIDLNGVRRQATADDMRTIMKLHQVNPAIHYNGGYTLEPMDVDVPVRHLHMVESSFNTTDKPIMGSPQSAYQARDSLEMAKIVFGKDYLDKNVAMTAIFNCNSPLVWDQTQLEALRIYAAHNQAMLLSPFVLYGASSPVHILAGTAQIVAEALAGVAFTQIIRPGSRAVMGVAPMGVYMKTGSPTFGSPEVALTMYVYGQMARYYGIPWRTNGAKTGAKQEDLYAGYDSILKVYPAILGGCNLLTHCGGTLEGSLCVSLGKLAADGQQLQSFYTMLKGVRFDDMDLVLDDLAKIGPGGHFFNEDYTRENLPFLDEVQDNERFESWIATGSKTVGERGRDWCRSMLDRYEQEPPTLDEAKREELRSFVGRRETEINAGQF
ncbi:trimethylamine---corrinoid protein Co-methyltransferase [Shimia gijangensis]|uniref:Methyltransferase n=1 Tax=Shimia gijangensis TaxID=1470563 RepID=A0A1M6CG53_9RHOB|nr:trimethylamine methyltransferase family protein [Shimia gijangensis]SHI59903.1 trimethylamine---corrinoid protein Co-methyltransferase [Shimia gijangensis]